jgi:hypothetical protein
MRVHGSISRSRIAVNEYVCTRRSRERYSDKVTSDRSALSSHHIQDDSLPDELREHVHRLRLILPVISVSVMALHRQDAEADTDIASVLSQHACEPLDSEIERIECILASRIWRGRQQEVRA